MLRDASGNYRATKMICLTNHELVGIGKTKEEARAKLKEELARYRDALAKGLESALKPTGETIRSPGMAMFTKANVGDQVVYRKVPDRKVAIFARPDLADWIRAGRNDKER